MMRSLYLYFEYTAFSCQLVVVGCFVNRYLTSTSQIKRVTAPNQLYNMIDGHELEDTHIIDYIEI